MKKYFITVSTLNNTTKLGALVAEYIQQTYDNTIVSDKQLLAIPNKIDDAMWYHISENKRLKPMTVSVHGYTRGIADPEMSDDIQIWMWSTDSGDNDNRPFTLHAKKIRMDFTTLGKGGDR